MRRWLPWSCLIVVFLTGAAVSQLRTTAEAPLLPIGTIVAYAADVGPMDSETRRALESAGWLVCDGSQVSRARFPKLFAAVGEIHGRGNASTTFNLPDYKGRFLRGVDAGAGRDPDAGRRDPANNGGLGGDQVGSVQDDEVRFHTHTTVQMIGTNAVDGVDSTTTASGEHHNEPRDTGACCGRETRPKNANVNWLIFAGRS